MKQFQFEEAVAMQVQVVRSRARKKTVSATLKNGVLVVRVPAGITQREEQEWVRRMREKLERKADRRRLENTEDLERRAQDLNRRYFEGRLRFSIRWVANQGQRWGSCTPGTQTIRISHELGPMPRWVLDYVIVHELAHLLQPDHSPAFWALVHRYPQTERAIGYLMGYTAACSRGGVPELCPGLCPEA